MASVLPWGPQSPLLLAGVLAAVLLGVVLLVWLRHAAGQLLARVEDAGPAPSFLRSPRMVRRARRTFGWALFLAGAHGLLHAAGWVWEPLRGLLLAPAVASLPEIVLLGATLTLAGMGLEAASHLAEALARRAERKGRAANAQVLHAVQTTLRYAIFLTAGLVAGVVALGLLGFEGDVGDAVVAWLTAQAGAIVFLASLVGIAWVGGRLIRGVATEARHTSRRLTPEVVDALGGLARGVLYAVLGLVGVFTVLQSVGLGSVGGTLIVVTSSLIGLTVAMAGTGSIGNALSGAVLLAFRPLHKGDRVVLLDDLVCDVEEVTLMFTRVRTLAHERVDVPNNQVLLKPIRNLSRSGPHAMVVPLSVGYDVPAATVREVALRAALATPHVLRDPPPRLYARDLGSYAVAYELYAYTADPRHLEPRSELLGRLQASFREAGVELLTPDVHVVRRVPVAGGPPGEETVRVAVQPEPSEPPGRRGPPS